MLGVIDVSDKLLRRDLFEEFCQEFTRETNRLRMAARAAVTATERELRRVQRELEKLVQALKDGVPASVVKEPIIALESQQAELQARVAHAAQPPPLLIPTWRTCTGRKLSNSPGAWNSKTVASQPTKPSAA
jgi:hypothetical protein